MIINLYPVMQRLTVISGRIRQQSFIYSSTLPKFVKNSLYLAIGKAAFYALSTFYITFFLLSTIQYA